MSRSSSGQILVAQPVRTAIGAFNGSLKDTPATELGATVVRETLRRASLDPGSAQRPRGVGGSGFGAPDALRDSAHAIKDHVLAHLDFYL